MSLNEKLMRKIDALQANEIALIITKLGDEFFDNEIKEVSGRLENEGAKIDSEKLKLLKELLKLLVAHDESITVKIDTILRESRDNTNKDISVALGETSIQIGNISLAMLFLYGLGKDIIKAHYPNFVKTKSKEINRGYKSDVAEFLQSLMDKKNGTKEES